MSENEEREFGWDDEINNDSSATWTLLPAGEYPFEIVDFQRARHEPKSGGKLPSCNKAVVTVRCYPPDGSDSSDIEHNLFLHSRCEGMLCEFFRSIGQRKHGEPLKPRWNDVIGSKGRCKIIVREYVGRDGEKKQTNDIKRFLDPPDVNSTPF